VRNAPIDEGEFKPHWKGAEKVKPQG